MYLTLFLPWRRMFWVRTSRRQLNPWLSVLESSKHEMIRRCCQLRFHHWRSTKPRQHTKCWTQKRRRKSKRQSERTPSKRRSRRNHLLKAVRFQFFDKRVRRSPRYIHKSINYVSLQCGDLLSTEAFSSWTRLHCSAFSRKQINRLNFHLILEKFYIPESLLYYGRETFGKEYWKNSNH